MARPDRKTRAGFSLLELMITATLAIGLSLITAQFWRYFSAHLGDLSGRARMAQELRLAVETILRDMGPAVGATPVGEDRLLVCKDDGPTPNGLPDWGLPDRTVLYSVVECQLVRDDQSSGTVVVIADNVSAFTVTDLNPSLLLMTVTVAHGGTSRDVSLLWSRP